MGIINVRNLKKSFQVYKKQPGILGSLKSLISRKYTDVIAVDDISFAIDEGELIGFIGPNGAGKTTTLKCLSGLLYPTSGEVNVLGFRPFERKNAFLKQISLVMGQKNQLWWDLPAMESFLLNKEIYEVNDLDFKKTVDDLSALLEVVEVLNVQVRRLSLGQRMKCELIAALLHRPKVLFLDEPTIGLDVVMQENLRNFIKEYNLRYRSTIILTSHYMQDVKELCERVIMIDHGRIIYDGKLDNIVKTYAKTKEIRVVLSKKITKEELSKYAKVMSYDFPKAVLTVGIEKTNQVAAKLLNDLPIIDITIEETPIEDIIRHIFRKKSV